MLTPQDYQSLKRSVKGWTAKKMAQYGLLWPPVHGWRTRLLKEYERADRTEPVKSSAWKTAPAIVVPPHGDVHKRTRQEWESILPNTRWLYKQRNRLEERIARDDRHDK
jgi:hypothetical protein